MRSGLKKRLYKGNLYRCTSFPSVAGAYFGVEYKEQLVASDITIVKLKNGLFSSFEDYRTNGKRANIFGERATSCGEYFVKDVKLFISEQEEQIEN